MTTVRIRSVCLAIVYLISCGARAQEADVAADTTLSTYTLEEIVVAGPATVTPATDFVRKVPLARIHLSRASSAGEFIRIIPAAHVQTNSRGETIVSLRSAGDRQFAVLFDGALLNIPWDNRYDLGLIAADVIGGMDVTRGASPALSGANSPGGTINLQPRTLGIAGRLTELSAQGGSAGLMQGRLTQLFRSPSLDYGISLGYSERAAIPLPSGHDLEFSQHEGGDRTNTDREVLDFFGQVTGRLGEGARLRLTLMRTDAEQGVAPEGHLDPATSRVRYWRYPRRSNTIVILGGDVPFGSGGTTLRGTVWGSHFAQEIDQYESATYDSSIERQEGEDNTFGTRLSVQLPVRNGTLRFALSALTSGHEQLDLARDGEMADWRPESDLHFRQHIWSAGAEYGWTPRARMRLLFGGSLDGVATPLTGDKPDRDPQVDVSVTSGLTVSLNSRSAVRISAGRRTRFPTMRELFGEALGRFLVNPDLSPESSITVEAGFDRWTDRARAEAVVFFERFYDTIDQRFVLLADEERPRRQRVNLEGGRTIGAEVIVQAGPASGLSFDGHLMWARARTFEDGGSAPRIEKPEWLGSGTLVYNRPSGLSVHLQAIYTGRAYGLDEDNAVVSLPTSLVLNGGIGYRRPLGRFGVEIFGRVDNVFDELSLPQPGLPGPGRTLRFGLELSMMKRASESR